MLRRQAIDMTEAFIQIRLLLAEMFLGWAMDLAPNDTDEKNEIAAFVFSYMKNRSKVFITETIVRGDKCGIQENFI